MNALLSRLRNPWPVLDAETLRADRLLAADTLEALLAACLRMVEWDEAEKAAKPFADDNGAAFYERMRMCRESFDLARAAIAKAEGK